MSGNGLLCEDCGTHHHPADFCPPKQPTMLIHRLQNSLLTRWIWRYWQHDETGRIALMPLWRSPGRRWHRVNYRE